MSDKKSANQNKATALVLHFSKNAFSVGRKKLAKLLYFIDFTSIELFGNSLTEYEYKKYTYGPIPVNFYSALKTMESDKSIKCHEQKGMLLPALIEPLSEPNYSLFSPKEMELIESITEKFKHSTAGELEKIAQSEAPYNMVEFDEVIPDHLAYYRNSFGSLDLTDDRT